MPGKEKLMCECGGLLSRPLPDNCPHCGARIVGVRRRLWTMVLPLVVVVAMFSGLIWFFFWLLKRQ
jgi:hypothetical protein